MFRIAIPLFSVLMQIFIIVLFIVFVFFNPYMSVEASPDSRGVVGTVIAQFALAVGGIGASLVRRPILMVLVAGGQLIPVGLYLLGTPGLFRWIGIAIIAYLMSAIILLAANKRQGRGLLS